MVKLGKYLDAANKKQGKSIVITSKYEKRIINTDEIIYIEVKGHKLIYYCFKETIESWGSISELYDQLKDNEFSLCSTFFLVNLKYV